MTELLKLDTETDDFIEIDKLPANLSKIILKFDSIKNKISIQKKTIDEVGKEIKDFEKMLNKIIKKTTKIETKPKKPRKPCGFALPSPVTDDLCDFMGLENGKKVARTEVTKYLMKYIEDNKLQNPENKKFILPDAKLWKLLGNEARDSSITHFTIQKYINKHFISSSKQVLENTMMLFEAN